jgi:hypothetical protein
MIKAPHQKNLSFPFNYYDLAIREATLTEIFSTYYWHSKVKILRLEVEKHHFILIIGPHINKYMFQHVSGPIFTKTALKF